MRNPENVGRTLDWSDCRIGACTPMDIDFVFDFHGFAILLAEFKAPGEKVPRGQHQLLIREAMTHTHAGKFAVLAYAESLPGKRCKKAMLVRYWYLNEWREGEGRTFGCLFDWWAGWVRSLDWTIRPPKPTRITHPERHGGLLVPNGWPSGLDDISALSAH